ncbi:hypothetical protein VTO73DRAFT_1426 [Trametes versicolor]
MNAENPTTRCFSGPSGSTPPSSTSADADLHGYTFILAPNSKKCPRRYAWPRTPPHEQGRRVLMRVVRTEQCKFRGVHRCWEEAGDERTESTASQWTSKGSARSKRLSFSGLGINFLHPVTRYRRIRNCMVLSLLWSLRGDAAAKHQQNSARPTFAAWQAGFDSVGHVSVEPVLHILRLGCFMDLPSFVWCIDYHPEQM